MLALLLALAVSTSQVFVVTLPARGDVTLGIPPNGKVELKREGTVSRVKVEIERIGSPGAAGPSYFTHVVWGVSPEGIVENLGELALDGTTGRLETISRFDQIGIIVTAEPHSLVNRPSSAVVYRNAQPADVGVRRVTVPVQVGLYDYSGIQLKPDPRIPTLIFQARAAVQIARNADAERWAEAEFRLARIALDTTETMFTRAAPLEILSTTANETIRRSHYAFLTSIDRSTRTALDEAGREIARLKEEKQQIEARVAELNEQLTGVNNQIRNLNAQIANAGKNNAELTAQREQAEASSRDSERELARFKRQQDDLQGKLALEFMPGHFDAKGSLTPAGREALARLCGIAQILPGPVRLSGFPSETSLGAAMLYLVNSGVPHDRIITRR